jgi:hypothetical protein
LLRRSRLRLDWIFSITPQADWLGAFVFWACKCGTKNHAAGTATAPEVSYALLPSSSRNAKNIVFSMFLHVGPAGMAKARKGLVETKTLTKGQL